MDPVTHSITGSRSLTPYAIKHWQATPMRLTLSLESGQNITGATSIFAEIHSDRGADPSTRLASVEVAVSDNDGPWTIDFTPPQMNQSVSAPSRTFWLVIAAKYPTDARPEILACATLQLHRHNAYLTTAQPPDPEASYLTAAEIATLYATTAALAAATGLITITSDAGAVQSYNPASDTDAARGTALLAAVTAATAGQTIKVGAGTFAIGNGRVLLPDDVHLDMDPGTVITGSTNLSTVGTIVRPGNRSHVRGGKILGTAASGISQAPFGLTNVLTDPDPPAIDWILENTILEADSDAFYVLSDEVCTGILLNPTLISKYDIIYASGNNGAPAAHDIRIYNPRGVVAGLSTIANPQGRGTTIAYGATVRIYGGSLDITDGGTILNAGVAVYVDGTLHLHDVAIRTSNGANPNYDLYTNGTGAIVVSGGTGSDTGGRYLTNSGSNVTFSVGPASEGGLATADAGKVPVFSSLGQLISTGLIIVSNANPNHISSLSAEDLTTLRNHKLPNDHGTLALQEWIQSQITVSIGTGEATISIFGTSFTVATL